MRLEELKKGFWGYKTEEVFQYITDLESDFSRKLLEKDEQRKAEKTEALARVKELEQENRALMAEIDRLKEQISAAVLDAPGSEAVKEGRAEELEKQTSEAEDAFPEGNLTLFQ